MSRVRSKGMVLSVALTWDGARWPTRALPPKARAFLAKAAPPAPAPSRRMMAELLRDDQVAELRICWVPRLKGGRDVLSEPFQTATGRRLGFRAKRTVVFGEILGVVYRRELSAPRKQGGTLAKVRGITRAPSS